MGAFLDLADEDVKRLGITLSFDQNVCLIDTSLGLLASIRHGVTSDDPQDPHLFTVLLCDVGDVSEADSRKVVLSPGSEPLGYSFPITALRSGEGIGPGWPSRFAEAGFKRLMTLESIDKFSKLRSTTDLRNLDIGIDELVSDAVVLFVLSNEALQKAGLTQTCLELSLLEQRIKLAAPYGARQLPGSLAVEGQNINLRMPHSLDEDDMAIFCKLLNQADNDYSDVGSFMTYYQLIEFCIDKIFQREIKRLPEVATDTWDLRQRLSELTNEVTRIGMLDQHYLMKPVRRERFDELRTECVDLLAKAGEKHKVGIAWYKALYLVRNLVVHNQMRFHRNAGNMALTRINNTLRSACVEALFTFSATTQHDQALQEKVAEPA